MNDTLPLNLPESKTSEMGKSAAKTTPMMEQYLSIKQQHPASLLFYRMGDFYELFFDDAATAATALDIALTHRGKHMGQEIPMCGVPVHAAETYLHRLIRKGFRVVVCEQTGEQVPSPGKKRSGKSVMHREVVRIVTPGTLTEDTLLDAKSHNYLAALARDSNDPEHCALAWADVSTGSFQVRRMPFEELPAELARLAPGELLVAESAFMLPAVQALEKEKSGMVTPLSEKDFSPALGEERLLRLLAIASLEAVAPYEALELAACGALVGYVETTQAGRLPSLEAPRRQASQTVMGIDPATRRNLELTRSISGERKDSLLGAIDRSITGAGARLLKEYLVAPLLDPVAIENRLDAVERLRDVSDLRAQLRSLLRNVPDMARALGRLSLERGGPRDLSALRDGLRTAHSIAAAFSSDDAKGDNLTAELPQELRQAVEDIGTRCADLEAHLQSALIEAPPTQLREGGMVASGYDAALDDQRKLRDDSRRVIASLQQRYMRETGIQSLKIRYNGILGYHLEVPANAADRLMQEPFSKTYVHRQTMANAVRFTTVELAELAERILRSAELAIEMEKNIFEKLCAEVMGASPVIKEIAAALARIDVFVALAELAESGDYSRPKVDDSRIFDIRGGRHPVVEAARAASGEFVPNDCALELPESEDGNDESLRVAGKRIWLLTGPNMAGKSTFLRQNALIAILAQMGSFVPAKSAHIGVIDRVFSRVGAADDLAGGRSTFMVEMIETAAILNQSSDRSLVILDEIGRGTATFDGLAIAWAVIEYLHDVNRCRAIFATHYHELTELRERLDALETVTLRSREWQGEIIFLHEVARGVADGSYGVQVARLAGLPDWVIGRAREKLDALEADGQSRTPLFTERKESAAASAPEHPAIALLKKISPDQLSPREALETLYRLRSLDGESDDKETS